MVDSSTAANPQLGEHTKDENSSELGVGKDKNYIRHLPSTLDSRLEHRQSASAAANLYGTDHQLPLKPHGMNSTSPCPASRLSARSTVIEASAAEPQADQLPAPHTSTPGTGGRSLFQPHGRR